MKLIALVSGGKDSVLAMMEGVKRGHEITCIANLRPPSPAADMVPSCEGDDGEEIDSHCFQTCGYRAVDHIAICMGVPLRTRIIREGQSVTTDLVYTTAEHKDTNISTSTPTVVDEVEEMYLLLKDIKEEFPDVGGVCSGAILSTYQRLRVEDVCRRLGLTSYSYLWNVAGATVLRMVREGCVDARLIKTASMGLLPKRHLGRSLADDDIWELLTSLEQQYQVHPAGEGGEFESIVLDCPLFPTKRLQMTASRIIMVEDNPYAPLGRLAFDTEVVDKSAEEMAASAQWMSTLPTVLDEFHTVETCISLPILIEAVTASCGGNTGGHQEGRCEDIEEFLTNNAMVCRSEEEVTSATLHLVKSSTAGQLARITVTCPPSTTTPQDQIRMLLTGLCKSDASILFIQIYAPCITTYKAVNKAYEEIIHAYPFPGYATGTFPARAFVARGVGPSGQLALSATFLVGSKPTINTLRVESVSLWAAAAIGPYSQGLSFTTPISKTTTASDSDDFDDEPTATNTVIISGRIGMVPSSLDMVIPPTPSERFIYEFCTTVLNVITGLAVLMPKGADSGIWGATAKEALRVLTTGSQSPLTVFVADASFVPLVQPAWKAIGAVQSIDTPSLRPLYVRIAPQLPKGAIFEMVSLLSVTECNPLK